MAEHEARAAREAAPEDAEVEVLLLGTVEARRRGRTLHLVGAKQRALLAALALEANHVVPDERLIRLLWPEEPPEAATDVLRVHVSKLRRAIEPGRGVEGEGAAEPRLVVRKPSGYQLTIPGERVDISRCRRLVGEARRAGEEGDDARALELLDEALGLWRGEPLTEFGDEAFAVGERSQLEKLRLETLEQRFEVCLGLGLHADVVGELEACATRYPLRERLQGQLMLALYRCGRQAEASEVYHRTSALLSEDLGMDPGPELQARFREILKQEPAAAPQVAAPRPRPRADEMPARRHNIPARLSSFIGREGAVRQVSRLLREHRLLTLVGPGGMGKTRLALEVAESALPDFPDGVWLTDLVTVSRPDAVVQAIHAALGLRQGREAALMTNLVDHLQPRRVLIVLDNCEHLVDAVAATVQDLLEECPGLSVLTTSRERLGITGEQAWPVSPLTLPARGQPPTVDAALGCEAVCLFIERARLARPTFELTDDNVRAVVEVCSRLDGIPLALELAAARVAGLGIEEIVERLSDRFRLLAGSSRAAVSRHRTMRETLDWSITLLSDEERVLFCRLGIFAGSFNLDAVESVCSDTALPRGAVASVMSRLVDKSLVVLELSGTAEGRYRLLETMREYVQERIVGDGAETLRARHARHYLERGKECERTYLDGQMIAARERYDVDYANARAALEWSSEADPELCLETAGRWRFYWWLQGSLSEGHEWLKRASKLDAGSPVARARVLSGLGRLSAIQGDLAGALANFSEGLVLAQAAEDDFMVAELTHSLGVVTVGGETNQEAEAYFRRAVELWQRVGYRQGLASAYGNLGECCFYAGKYEEARAGYLRQVAMGQDYSRFNALLNLSHLERFLGNYEAARGRAAEALPLSTPLYAAVALEAFTFLAAAKDDAVRAATLGAAAARLYALHGARPDPMPQREAAEARLREVIGRLDGRRLAEANRRGAEMSLPEVVDYALSEPAA